MRYWKRALNECIIASKNENIFTDGHTTKTKPVHCKTDDIVEHIESYMPQFSLYKLANCPNRRCLDPSQTVADIHAEYKSR